MCRSSYTLSKGASGFSLLSLSHAPFPISVALIMEVVGVDFPKSLDFFGKSKKREESP
jgi:hypothetical protein